MATKGRGGRSKGREGRGEINLDPEVVQVLQELQRSDLGVLSDGGDDLMGEG
jgi:hypothetical protein